MEEQNVSAVIDIGNNTFKWCYAVHNRKLPNEAPYLELISPSGQTWKFNNYSDTNQISGLAEEFCQVVTQVRNIKDVKLNLRGNDAEEWMSIAQCFAGPAEKPPAPGTRKMIQR